MKLNKLAMAVAAGTFASAAMADNVQSPFSNTVLNGEAYAHINQTTEENNLPGGTEDETSTKDLDSVRFGFTTQFKEDVTLGFELEHDLNGGAGGTSSTIVNDLYLAKSYGDWTVTGGRFKQIADRNEAIERSDRLFTEMSTGAFSTSNLTSNLSGAESYDRRVEGIEGQYSNASGLHGSLAVYTGGVENETKSNGDTETSEQLSYAASIGWIGNSDGLTFGATLAYFNQEASETKTPGLTTDMSISGFGLTGILQTGAVTASLSYADGEQEDNDSVSGDTEYAADGIKLSGAFNLGNAQRSFNELGILQGPSRSSGDDWGHEIVVYYGMGELETTTPSGKSLADSGEGTEWGIGYNAYCGANSRLSLSLTNSDYEDDQATPGTDEEVQSITLGYRFNF